jgi:diguanylate cyclase (GGDEF)-like protein/PAS domain S-box-containing protein
MQTFSDDLTERGREPAAVDAEALRAVVEFAPDAIVGVDTGGRIVLVNAQAEQLFGYTREELLGERLELLVPDRMRAGHEMHRHGYMRDPHTRPMGQGLHLWGRRRDGSEFPAEISLSCVPSGSGSIAVAAVRDVSQRRAVERRLAERERLLAEAQALAHVGWWEWGLSEPRMQWSDEMCRIFGRAPGFAPTIEETLAMVHPEDRERVAVALRGADPESVTESRHRIVRPDGEVRYVHARRFEIADESGQVSRLFGTVQDVTEREAAERELERLAAQDPLTGLPNQRVFRERLGSELARATRSGRPLSVAVLDLDHFKNVNDRHGHVVGDHVLQEVAGRLAALTREGEMIARVGGEEFAWILPEATAEGAMAAAERARRAVSEIPLAPVGRLTMSVGVCDLATAGEPADLYRLADEALFVAKRRGRDQAIRYDAA